MNDTPVQTTNYVADPGRVADLARRIREGELSPADLAAYFPCFERVLDQGCRFRDCLHRDEPDCSVIEAVAGGELDAARHEIYLGLLADLERVAERQARGARS